MSWPIGYGNPEVRFHADASGRLLANGLPVTEPGGWVDLPAPDWRNDPSGELSVRVRAADDAQGRPFLFVEQCELGGRRYAGIHSLVLAEGHGWPEHIVVAFHSHVKRRTAFAESPTRRMTAVSRPREPERFATPETTPYAGISALSSDREIAAALGRARSNASAVRATGLETPTSDSPQLAKVS